MKKCLILVSLFILLVVPKSVSASNEGYELVSKLSEEDIVLYAKEINGLYRDFKIDFKGEVYSRPFWLSVANNPTYAPQIYYEDINEDEKKELIVGKLENI
ncbi:hypothetical protein [Neobacillus muris]|uniref:hypothetical protein n=1 Tax=Neobacillus muris TaxID=2941334 RepID=UPI00203EEB9C|nr:hypothetical protein [Neobacillus muris]